MARSIATFLFAVIALFHGVSAFSIQGSSIVSSSRSENKSFHLNAKKKIDFSSIETRDLTREEMQAINEKNERVMNMELQMMTAFSLVISLPILYLCWVAFNSD
jgi:hypothetical protein